MGLSVRIIETASHQQIGTWQLRLGLQTWEARLEPVDPMQVTGEDGLPGAELVGVIIRVTHFTIVHTRPLAIDDIIHELLHVAWPHWPHAEVELWTARLVLNADLAVVAEEARNKTIVFAQPLDREPRKELQDMPREFTAFNLRTRQECTILNPEIVTMRNGRKAVQGTASDDGKTRVFRILGAKDIAETSAQ
jgi:hypothetical protein